MFRFVLCDDELPMLEQLTEYIGRFSRECGIQIDVTVFPDGESLLFAYPKDADVVLLDIGLAKENGIEVAKKIRQFTPEVCLIFITSMTRLAIKGYSVRAFGFIPKPVTYEALKHELRAALEQIWQKDKHLVGVNDNIKGVYEQINAQNILYFEVKGHNMIVNLRDRQLHTRGSISSYLAQLSAYGFLRCHASFLVNYRWIANITPAEVILQNGARVPVSKARRKKFMEDLAIFVGKLL